MTTTTDEGKLASHAQNEESSASETPRSIPARRALFYFLLFVCGVMGLSAEPPGSWCGAALLLSGLFEWVRSGGIERLGSRTVWFRQGSVTIGNREFSAGTLLAEGGSLGLLALVTTVVMPRALSGDRLVSHDHPVHFFKAWQTNFELLPKGELFVWSHQWFAGYPANYLYPPGADLWIAAFHRVSFGLLSFDSAYAVGTWGFYLFTGYAVYRLGALAFGRAVGLLAGVAFLADPGAFRFGGWVYTLEWGVWPQMLSTAFGLMAAGHVLRVQRAANTEDDAQIWLSTGLFAWFLGMALITHPAQLFHVLVLVPASLLALLGTRPKRRYLTFGTPVTIGMISGGLIGSLWLLPFLSTRSFAAAYGVPWVTAHEMGQATILGGAPLPGTWIVVGLAGAVGVAALLFARTFEARFIGLVPAMLFLASSTSFVANFRLLELSHSVNFIQWQRFAILLKPYFFIAAAFAVVCLARGLLPHLRNRTGIDESGGSSLSLTRFAVVFAAFLLLVPFAIPAARAVVRYHIPPRVKMVVESERDFREDRRQFVEWAQRYFADRKDDGFFRLSIFFDPHYHGFVDLGSVLDVPIYKVGFTPCSNFKFKLGQPKRATLTALNVRYILTDRDGLAPEDSFRLVKTFGALRVYEYSGWTSQPFAISGDGEVVLDRFEDDGVTLTAAPGSTGTLRLNVSYFPRWTATRDGRPVPISIEQLDAVPESGFIAVPLRQGKYVFEFRRNAIDHLGLLFFLSGMLLVACLMLVGSQWGRESRVGSLGSRLMRWTRAADDNRRERNDLLLVILLGASLILVLFLAAAGWLSGTTSPNSVVSLRSHVRDALVTVHAEHKSYECKWFFGRAECPRPLQHAVEPTVASVKFGKLEPCISATATNVPVAISFAGLPKGDRLEGWFVLPVELGTSGREPAVTIIIAVNDEVAFKGTASLPGDIVPFELALPRDAAGTDLSFLVKVEGEGAREVCLAGEILSKD